MKNHRKFLLYLIFLFISILLFCIIQIYAKYITSATGNTALTIANWNISVNDLSIQENTDISNSIVPVFPGNEHISSDIIAPTSEGYFDLNFDFSNADVSFEYEITTTPDENSLVKDLVVTGYSIDGGEKVTFEEYNTPIKEIIALSDDVEARSLRVFILWDDNEETQTMSNEDDTLSTTTENPAILHVDISFTQITDIPPEEPPVEEPPVEEPVTP